jgi:hypothetical protein
MAHPDGLGAGLFRPSAVAREVFFLRSEDDFSVNHQRGSVAASKNQPGPAISKMSCGLLMVINLTSFSCFTLNVFTKRIGW